MDFAFADILLDTSKGELYRKGARIEVQPKAFALLQYLIEKRGRVVSKEELLDSLWPGMVVSEGVLKRAMHALRVAVGDSGTRQAVIETRMRLGYRFVAELKPVPSESSGTGSRSSAEQARVSDFVGRELALGDLQSAWARARTNKGSLVLVAGPAGIGKTRLVDELADRVGSEGGRLFRGWCDQSRGAPPYWPWLQVARGLGEDVVEQLGAIDIRDGSESPAAERLERASRSIFVRQDSLSRSLIASSGDGPILIILEDLHWADRASLAALSFVARAIANASILIIGTFRDDELPADHPLVTDLRQLTPRASDLRIHLQGLEVADVRRLLSGLAGGEPSEAAVDGVYGRTSGNPLFVREVARYLLAMGSIEDAAGSQAWLGEVPLGVLGVIEQRLQQLPSASRSLLEVAAVIGSVFDRHLLAALTGRDLAFVADGLAPARVRGVIRASRESPSEWEFVHALMRDTLIQSTNPGRLVDLERELLAELERRYLPHPESFLARLADHANAIYRSGGDALKAIGYDRLTAWHEAARYAYHDCARHAQRALETLRSLETRAVVDPILSIELRIDRARAAVMLGESAAALSLAEEAARLARDRGDFTTLARAALSVHIDLPAEADLVRRKIELLKLAEEKQAPGTAMSVRLVSDRVMQLSDVPQSGLVRVRDGAKALEWARTLGDPVALVHALSADLMANWSRHEPKVRLAYARELNEGVADMPDRFLDVVTLVSALVEHGDLEGWDELIQRMRTKIAAASADKYYAYYVPLYTATRALWQGELALAEDLMLEALACTEVAGPKWGPRAYATQLSQLRIDQGRIGELEPGVRALRTQFPNDYSFPALLAYLLCEQGRLDEARPIFEGAADGYQYESDINATVTLTVMSRVCASLGDAKRAEVLYELLVPLEEIVAVNMGCWICQGSVHWPLGMLAATAGRENDGIRHLELAVSRNRGLGIRTYEARAGVDLAELLAASEVPGRRGGVAAVLGPALALAREIGMPQVIAQGEALESSPQG